MLLPELTTRLRELGLRTRPEVVCEAVQRLRNGESLYGLHSGETPLVAKGTARKIKKLLDEGKLGFLFEVRPGLEAAQSAGMEIEADSPVWIQNRFCKYRDEDEIRERVRTQSERFFSLSPDFDWNIEHLESIGISLDEALSLLVEHDTLRERRTEWKFADLQRYIEIFHIALMCQQQSQREHGAPYEFVNLAAAAAAKAFIDDNRFLLKTSANILMYQVWRGSKFVEAFKRAQAPTHRAARQLKQKYDALITEMSDLDRTSENVGL